MRRTVTTLLVVFALAACGGNAGEGLSTATTTTIAAVPTTISTPPVVEQAPDIAFNLWGVATDDLGKGETLVAIATKDLAIYRTPAAARPFLTLPDETILGTVTVLSIVEGPRDGWARALLPTRPNGSTGWVHLADTPLYVVNGRIVVDVSERSLRYYENGSLVMETPVAVGTTSNPTPVGSFFVTDNVTLADADSPWGPFALGLSARSDTITQYNGGDGIIGIHGTNRPSSIGQAASLGCVRVPNDVIAQLHEMVPIGTPVDIVA